MTQKTKKLKRNISLTKKGGSSVDFKETKYLAALLYFNGFFLPVDDYTRGKCSDFEDSLARLAAFLQQSIEFDSMSTCMHFNKFIKDCPTVKKFKELKSEDDLVAIKQKVRPIVKDFYAFICFNLDAMLYFKPEKLTKDAIVWLPIFYTVSQIKGLPQKIKQILTNERDSKYIISGHELSYIRTDDKYRYAYTAFPNIKRTPIQNILKQVSSSNSNIPDDHNIIFKINVPKNTGVIYFSGAGQYILPRGSKFELHKIKNLKNYVEFHVTYCTDKDRDHMKSFFSSEDYNKKLDSFIEYKKQFEKYLENQWKTSKSNVNHWVFEKLSS